MRELKQMRARSLRSRPRWMIGELNHDGATSVLTRTVAVTEPPNTAPGAAFTSTVDDLVASFDAAGSSDPDGTVESYAWDFGDGTGGSGVSPDHTFAASGTYTVRLRVSDDGGGTDTVSHDVEVAANRRPEAAFISAVDDLRAGLDGTASGDPDGAVKSYAWDFG